MEDGETIADAIADGELALASVLAMYREDGRSLLTAGESQSGKFVRRLLMSLHDRLIA